MKRLLKKLKKENKKLDKKIVKLNNFIDGNIFETLSKEIQNLLSIQVLTMAAYSNTLHARIEFIEDL